ncbi:MAG: alpha/beta hydrolase [Kiritimatiellae bacterium]|nr:alpha/beta hydrolase [Kiritimatiellia bacterium]
MEPSKSLPVPGAVFSVAGHTAFLIAPTNMEAGRATPWVWYAPTLSGLPGPEEAWMINKFLEAGMAVAGVDVGESFGSPAGRAIFTSLYEELVRRGFSKRPCLLARSRGGLMLYNWAVEHPASVAAIAGIYPVCDPSSYPGIEGACAAYGMTSQQFADALPQHNPVSRVAALAKAQVPIYHIHGDCDTLVPLDRNSAALAEAYRRAGGKEMQLVVIQGQGHNMWEGWFKSQELVAFVIAHGKARQ